MSKKNQDYDEFIEKFKPKKTTDDCYTPRLCMRRYWAGHARTSTLPTACGTPVLSWRKFRALRLPRQELKDDKKMKVLSSANESTCVGC